MRGTGAQRPGAAVRAGCPLLWPALSQADHQHGSAINSEVSLRARAAVMITGAAKIGEADDRADRVDLYSADWLR
jgi:hypothetical protein